MLRVIEWQPVETAPEDSKLFLGAAELSPFARVVHTISFLTTCSLCFTLRASPAVAGPSEKVANLSHSRSSETVGLSIRSPMHSSICELFFETAIAS
jgi:hypothetical protein